MSYHRIILRQVLTLVPFLVVVSAYSCARKDYLGEVFELSVVDTLVYYIDWRVSPYKEWSSSDRIEINQYAPLGFSHQSAAVYGDYAFLVSEGRSQICLFSMTRKSILYTLPLKVENKNTYHCNQCTFGVGRYAPSDFFPLLYISQRAKTDGRCFIEVYRIFPLYNEDMLEFDSFYVELVQTIYLPKMTRDNSLGNANCVIDSTDKVMYTYSRNNTPSDDNYGQCKISRFNIPDIYIRTVVLQDDTILSSFTIDASAVNMQGGCIQDGILYIGQGYASAGYIFLNVIDLEKKKLIARIDLQKYKVSWEPEGCIFYDGSVMLTHTKAICRVNK